MLDDKITVESPESIIAAERDRIGCSWHISVGADYGDVTEAACDTCQHLSTCASDIFGDVDSCELGHLTHDGACLYHEICVYPGIPATAYHAIFHNKQTKENAK